MSRNDGDCILRNFVGSVKRDILLDGKLHGNLLASLHAMRMLTDVLTRNGMLDNSEGVHHETCKLKFVDRPGFKERWLTFSGVQAPTTSRWWSHPHVQPRVRGKKVEDSPCIPVN